MLRHSLTQGLRTLVITMSKPNVQISIARAVSLVRDAQALLICADCVNFTEADAQPSDMPHENLLPLFGLRGKKGAWCDPYLVWGHFGRLLQNSRNATPNPGLSILRRWASRMPACCQVLTNDMDGSFQRAGFPTRNVVEHMGSIHELQCTRDAAHGIWSAECVQPQLDPQQKRWLGALPSCPHCQALALPNVAIGSCVWHPGHYAQQIRRHEAWLRGLQARKQRLVVIELETRQEIDSVHKFAERARKRLAHLGARLINIGPHIATTPTPQDIALPLGALEALQAIDALMCES